MKRVVHISLGTDVGGMEKLLVEFARLIDRTRFELAFISLGKLGKLAAQINEMQWPVLALDKQAGVDPRLIYRLARQLRRLRPDVVHTHNTAGCFYGVTAAKLARIPKIIHTRHGQRFYASRRETWIFRTLCRFVSRVISVSEDGRRRTVADGVRAERTCTIRNGIDLARFPYAGPTATGPAILVARLSPEKDVTTLIRAVHHLRQSSRRRENELRLDVVGDGTARAQLETLARQLSVNDLVRFHGERSDVHTLLAGASMFVLPSLTEGISLTLLEAMATGLPVVATRVGGNPEVVADGVTGLLVPAEDPVTMATAMERIYRAPSLAREMGRQGRQRVESEFSIQEMIRRYEEQYMDDAGR